MKWLRDAEGRTATADAARLVEQHGELAGQRRLRRRYDERQTRAAVALIAGRRAARPKFADAGELFCDREADQAMFDALKANLNNDIEVVELDNNINDREFSARAVQLMLDLIAQKNR